MSAAVRIDRVGVLVPVRIEELLLPHCLAALDAATGAVRADRYSAAGGFARIDTGEDVQPVAALRSLNEVYARTAHIPVLTCGRLTGRAPAGFADYRQDVATDVHAP